MEGRINRDSLAPGTEKKYEATERRGTSASKPHRSAYKNYRGEYSGYRRRYSTTRRELIPEGKDMMIVQLLASGILLLFVMFVSLVPSTQTVEVKGKLKEAFSNNTSPEEMAENFKDLKNKLTGIDDLIAPDEDVQGENVYTDSNKTEQTQQIEETPNESDITVDPEILREINEQADASKN